MLDATTAAAGRGSIECQGTVKEWSYIVIYQV